MKSIVISTVAATLTLASSAFAQTSPNAVPGGADAATGPETYPAGSSTSREPSGYRTHESALPSRDAPGSTNSSGGSSFDPGGSRGTGTGVGNPTTTTR
jgi:hypothetical protein